MQAMILAAGMGNRLGRFTRDNTKCMLSINGKTLIERALDALDRAGIRRCVLVTGYKKENVSAFLGNKYGNIAIEYVFNDVYNKTNNIYSLYLARDFLLQDDTILLESDLIFEDSVIEEMVSSSDSTIAAVAKWETWMDGTVVELAENNRIAAFIPKKLFDFNKKDSYYKTVNIYKFSRDFSERTYIPFLEAYVRAMGNNEYYEQVLRVIASLDKCELKAFIVTGKKWYEIDDAQDMDIAETIFAKDKSERLKAIKRRYGGYWRFPGLLDFCYLVNPYFPGKKMLEEINSCFKTLLTEYPSGLNEQNMLSAKLFGIEETQILTGNGAAELIRALPGAVTGVIGVVYPAFNEYEESFLQNSDCKIVSWTPVNFTYNKDDLLAFSAQCDTLVLVNPDNPSGNYIPKNDVLAIAGELEKQHKRLILDESFVDFAGEKDASLIKPDIITRYPNLVVIKSLSKSYGIPGIRLGVLASGNAALIAQVRKKLPIWNINSFGEFFLQIIGKYQSDYVHSCSLIVQEREWFKTELEKTGILEVYPSEANFFLCKIKNGITAKALAERLLGDHAIFIKDLDGKKGISGSSFIRIALRDRADNKKLLETLLSIQDEKGI